MGLRGVEERIAWMLANHPPEAGRCAEQVMRALAADRQGFPDATAVLRRVKADGHLHPVGPCPRGAIGYWSGGSAGHGHVAIGLGDQSQSYAGVDVNGAGTTGAKPLAWYCNRWPRLHFEGWSWWWGGIDTQPKEAPMSVPRKGLSLAAWPVGKQLLVEVKGTKTVRVPGGKWVTLGIIDLPKGGRFAATLQVRQPKGGKAGEVELTRLGWGDAKTATDRDATGGNPLPAASVIRRWRTPIEGHPLAGGGPLEARIWLPAAATIEFVYKVERRS